jgi:hypothetical protein
MLFIPVTANPTSCGPGAANKKRPFIGQSSLTGGGSFRIALLSCNACYPALRHPGYERSPGPSSARPDSGEPRVPRLQLSVHFVGKGGKGILAASESIEDAPGRACVAAWASQRSLHARSHNVRAPRPFRTRTQLPMSHCNKIKKTPFRVLFLS